MSTNWLLDEEPAIPIDYVTAQSGYVNRTRGSRTTLQCRFYPSDHSAINEEVITGFSDRYRAARAYLEYANAVNTITSIEGKTFFVERLPPIAPVETQFVKVRPPDNNDNPDFWAVITGGNTTTEADNERRRLELEVTYLGEVDDYADRSAARSVLEA